MFLSVHRTYRVLLECARDVEVIAKRMGYVIVTKNRDIRLLSEFDRCPGKRVAASPVNAWMFTREKPLDIYLGSAVEGLINPP